MIVIPLQSNGGLDFNPTLEVEADILGDLATLAARPFAFDSIYIYSHGWWTTANSALKGYCKFSISLARAFLEPRSSAALGIGCGNTLAGRCQRR